MFLCFADRELQYEINDLAKRASKEWLEQRQSKAERKKAEAKAVAKEKKKAAQAQKEAAAAERAAQKAAEKAAKKAVKKQEKREKTSKKKATARKDRRAATRRAERAAGKEAPIVRAEKKSTDFLVNNNSMSAIPEFLCGMNSSAPGARGVEGQVRPRASSGPPPAGT